MTMTMTMIMTMTMTMTTTIKVMTTMAVATRTIPYGNLVTMTARPDVTDFLLTTFFNKLSHLATRRIITDMRKH